MSLAFHAIPLQSDAFDPAADSVLVTDGASFAGSGKRLVPDIFRANVLTITGTTVTLSQTTHNGSLLRFTASGAINVYASLTGSGLLAGFNSTIVMVGSGQATFVGSGVTINNRLGNTKSAGQWAVLGIMLESTSSIVLGGDTTS